MMAICCSGCSAILGVTEYMNSGALLKQLEGKVQAVESQLGIIEMVIQQVKSILTRR
ncbi:hypothetical protein ABID21_001905 [Pseudorhizobium tarimense]|uniref:Uncharacterized protein n=1 Tax=Pseudorhizobium tarimense TaxID=1079109 RepID=A0ABV2H5N0_9HYPH|nr:hypothetical protein [Pseudorhizobium tarimense]MCJ8518999.1 hypothetical protein [Pseudorhizobium tarimense]